MSPGGPHGRRSRPGRPPTSGATAGAPTQGMVAGHGRTTRRTGGTSPSGESLPTGRRSGATAR
eukprot:3742830-Alexandrium_andersonii.AAC.1